LDQNHFLGVLQTQLNDCPDDFFMDALSSESFLRNSLVELVSNIKDAQTVPNKALNKRVDTLIAMLNKRFKWDILTEIHGLEMLSLNDDGNDDGEGGKFTSRKRRGEFAPVLVDLDDDEYAPVVVELPPEDE
jgi:hypothetical protein